MQLPAFTALLVFLLTGCHYPTPKATPQWPALPVDPFVPISFVMFEEDFNDNDLTSPSPGWYHMGFSAPYHDQVCSAGDCWLRVNGPESNAENLGPSAGIRHGLGSASGNVEATLDTNDEHEGIKPTYISFNFFSWVSMSPARVGYFVLAGDAKTSEVDIVPHPKSGIVFYVQGEQMIVNGFAFLLDQVNWESHWFQVEFKNIQWDGMDQKFG